MMIEELANELVESNERLLEELVAMRKKHHLTQEVVAERMGVSQPTVAAFERYDANPKLSTIRRYALAVGAMIETSVEDRCCGYDEATFYSVVGGTPARWAKNQSSAWGAWTPWMKESSVYA